MEPRYPNTAHYGHARPRSPTFNPARASLPSSIGYSSMYGGDIHVMPTSTRYSTGTSNRHRPAASPTTTTHYAVSKDPLARGPNLREASRSRRSSTLDSSSPRPVIVTTTQRPQGHQPSHSSGGRHSSPTRDDYRTSDSSFYTQPASSIRSRSHARGNSYGTHDEFAHLRTGDNLSARHDTYRSRTPAIYSNTPRHSGTNVAYGGEGYEYTNPSDLARYDLTHDRPTRSQRRESFDRGYSRPHVNVPTDAGWAYNSSTRYDNRGGPPPSTRGFDKITRSSTVVPYEAPPLQDSVPPTVPAAPQRLQVPDSPKERRTGGSPEVGAVSNAESRGPRRRPVSVYQEGAPRSIHHEDYYRSREDDRAQKLSRDHERELDQGYGTIHTDSFRDESIAARGFGIRTEPLTAPARNDAATAGADYDNRRDVRKEPHASSEGRRTSEEDSRRPVIYDKPKEHRDRRTSTANDEEPDRNRLRDKVGTGLGIAATALGLQHAVGKDKDKDGKLPEKSDQESSRRRSPDDDRDRRREEDLSSKPSDRYRPREESRDPRDRATVIVETRPSVPQPKDEAETRDRLRREAEGRLGGEGPRGGAPREASSDEEAISKTKRRRPSIAFDPTNTSDLKALKEQMAAMNAAETSKPRLDRPVDAELSRDPRESRELRDPRESRELRDSRDQRDSKDSRDYRDNRTAAAELPRDYREPHSSTTEPPRDYRDSRATVAEPARDYKDYKDARSVPVDSYRDHRESRSAVPELMRDSKNAQAVTPPIPPKEPILPPSQDSTLVGGKDESRGRELTPLKTEDKQVRVVSPPRDKTDSKPLKGILKQPSKFPEEHNPIREGVAPHKDDKKLKDAPAGARWTKISRKVVNPEALTVGKERFEVRDDFVIVLRVLSKEEIQAYASATQILRGRPFDSLLPHGTLLTYFQERRRDGERTSDRDRDRDADRVRDRERGRDRDGDDDERSKPYRQHRRDDDYDKYDDDREKDRGDRHRRHEEDSRHHRRHRGDRERDQLAIEG
ncbi:hypothetical protein D7B24_001235 [Verticillium nonalfalfae]|uniref:DUF8035 domain-containing protein n=1 Tax=Verticillium nonalfalfae TaxID=1051616 RepID=A0A3M9Y376_9PEZI|nr:uncharacterized protein D7B24_001235 [Verticillium nonalfalfae]RNJ53878.1 hypothetical protein D7B24_001235 [Verticillium nonalfalfae]